MNHKQSVSVNSFPGAISILPPTKEDKTMFRNEKDSVLGSKKLSPNQFLNMAQFQPKSYLSNNPNLPFIWNSKSL